LIKIHSIPTCKKHAALGIEIRLDYRPETRQLYLRRLRGRVFLLPRRGKQFRTVDPLGATAATPGKIGLRGRVKVTGSAWVKAVAGWAADCRKIVHRNDKNRLNIVASLSIFGRKNST
jgi:hypothetical protein